MCPENKSHFSLLILKRGDLPEVYKCTLCTAAASTEPWPCSIHLFVVVSVFTVVVVVNAVARGTAGGGEEYEKDDDRSQH